MATIQTILIIIGEIFLGGVFFTMTASRDAANKVANAESLKAIDVKDLIYLRRMYDWMGRFVIIKIILLVLVAMTLYFQWKSAMGIFVVAYSVSLYIFLKLFVNRRRWGVRLLLKKKQAG